MVARDAFGLVPSFIGRERESLPRETNDRMNNNPQSPNLPLATNTAANIAGIPTRRRPSGSPPRPPASTLAPAFEHEVTTGRKPNAEFMEDFLIISGLIAVQIIGAFYTVLLKPILSLGIKPLFLVIFGSLAMAFFIFPFAIALEKKKWPSKLSLTLVVQFILISLGGVTTFQSLMFVGIKKTSPAIASAMPNLAPGIIFIIAACLRLEKLDFKCNYTRTKILGTLVCLTGAVALSILQSPIDPADSRLSSVLPSPSPVNVSKDWIIGCCSLLGAVLVLSCSTVLQAATMKEFPAPLSLCFVTSLLASILTTIVQFVIEGELDFGQPTISIQAIISFVFLGGMLIAVCVAFQTWAVLRKGPVMVSMFNPIQTVCSTVLSTIILGQVIKFESFVGMLAMFFGLYMVLWAKMKEGFGLPNTPDDQDKLTESTTTEEEDIERPLLS